MKKIKLLIVGIFTLMLWGSYSFGASMSILPYMGAIGKNCVQDFSVVLDLEEGESGTALEVVLQSNMEFVGFQKSDMFDYEIPYYEDDKGLHLGLFNLSGAILQGGTVGKVYYKIVGDEETYISYLFYDDKSPRDTSFFNGGVDILTSVVGGKYDVNFDIICENEDFHNMLFDNGTIDDLIDKIEFDYNNEMDESNNFNYCRLCVIIAGILLILFVLLLLLRKKGKRE